MTNLSDLRDDIPQDVMDTLLMDLFNGIITVEQLKEILTYNYNDIE